MSGSRITRATMRKAARDEKAVRKAANETGGLEPFATADSFQNFALKLGVGTDNATMSGGTYGFNPITRVRTLLEWIHRGSWLGGMAVDVVADDMTRAGIDFNGDIGPKDTDKIQNVLSNSVWPALNDMIKWARLYGGAISIILIDGQRLDTPLRPETVGKGQFKGMLTLDRWMAEPSMQDLVTEYGPHFGLPKFYTTLADVSGMPRMKVHYTRCVRMEGIRLPYWQRVQEQLWGISVLERLYDRMIAFDSATTGAAQLIYKSFIRTYKINNLRRVVAAGGDTLAGLVKYVDMMRRFQGIEGMTLLDKEDEFEPNQRTAFGGIADLITQFGQQLSGALEIPLVRLFGQSPVGLNSTGESDLRMYYDAIRKQQERWLRPTLTPVIECVAASEGVNLKDSTYEFTPLWQLKDADKATAANTTVQAVMAATDGGLIKRSTALKELRKSSRTTGIFGAISDEEIKDADLAPPVGAIGEPGDPGMDPMGIGPDGTAEETGILAPPEPTVDSGLLSKFQGFDVVIETPKGQRRGEWPIEMPAHYGYIRGTSSTEGPHEQMDCFIGPNEGAQTAYVVHQKDLESGQFDEHKVMLGFDSRKAALDCYVSSFADGKGRDRVIKTDSHSMADLQDFLTSWGLRYRMAAE